VTALTRKLNEAPYHTPVLLSEALQFLITRSDGVYVDGTVGGGGHAEGILERLDAQGKLIALDADDDALRASGDRLRKFGTRLLLRKSTFGNLTSTLNELKVSSIDGLLLDLGVSSHQLDDASRGFSFQTDSRIDMRMDTTQVFDAGEVVNRYSEGELAEMISTYGEERHARRIARAIVRERSRGELITTGAVRNAVGSAVTGGFLAKTLARVFQAIRIEVNRELDQLRTVLAEAPRLLRRGGRLVVISYHSLEDRLVKEALRQASATSVPSGNLLVPDTVVVPTFRLLTRKPVTASEAEQWTNPRARSAKLRAAEKV
jgi:16S rRNA (cytosine1402-N4)-methyltransferase